MHSLRPLLSPVFCLSLLASPIQQAGNSAAGRPDVPASSYQANDAGVLPDYPVAYTIEELLEGKDKELALAFELARKS